MTVLLPRMSLESLTSRSPVPRAASKTPPYSIALTLTVRVVLGAHYVITTLAGILLNTLVIALVAKYRKLQTHSFAIALQVVALNLLRATIFLVDQANVVANRWLFGEHICSLTGILVTSSESSFDVCVCLRSLSLRLLAVFLPKAQG